MRSQRWTRPVTNIHAHSTYAISRPNSLGSCLQHVSEALLCRWKQTAINWKEFWGQRPLRRKKEQGSGGALRQH